MKRFAFAAMLTLVLPLAACNQPNQPSPQPNPPTPTAPNKPSVDIQTPNSSVKSENGQTTVRTPNTDVDVNKK
jgi:hypothetical protein